MKKLVASLLAAALTAISALAQTPVYLDFNAPIQDRVEDALARMTLDEKLALCHAEGKFSSAGVPRLGIPGLRMSDGPHGVRAEVKWNDWDYAGWTCDSVTAFPALTALAATWNPKMAAIYGKAIGEEALYRGKNVLLGPGVNIYRTPLNGRNFEYMGEDPYLAGEMVVPYVQELQKNGVAACVKHFALNNQETWRGSVDVKLSDRALYEIYLPAFKRALVDGDAWSVMGAYNRIWGQHCCHNQRLLNDILHGEWEYPGVVITDWGGAHDTREAALNGLDIEMGTYTNGLTTESSYGYECYYLANPYRDMLEKGEVPMSTLDDKARRILKLIFLTSMNPARSFGSLASPEHYAVAKEIGDESIVLLKNDGILPLALGRKILVVGENATRRLTDGGGSSELKPRTYLSPLQAIQETYGADNVAYARGYASGRPMYGRIDSIPQYVTDSLRAEAVAMAADADVVIYIGGLNKNAYQDCEDKDRSTYHLSFGQDELIESLIAANPNIIIANITGNAYAMPWVDRVPAVLHISYLGTMGGASMADAISGKVNPSGKLPYSIPVRLEDCGAHSFGAESYPGIKPEGGLPQQQYLEDILVGYRWHDTKRIPALFPFGHGLSYTKFEYGKPQLSADAMTEDGAITITVPVTNMGATGGMEVVQLYIGDDKASVLRPAKELKAFQKIVLKPGQTSDVTFTITADALKYFDSDAHQWVAEPGTFTAYIGSSSTDIRSRSKFRLRP